MPPATTPKIATAMITTNSGSVTPTDGSPELKGSNVTVTEMPIGDREHDENQAERNQDQAVKNFRIISLATAA